jgi:hypothetical protein
MSNATQTPINEVVASPRAVKALRDNGFRYIEQVTDLEEVARIPHVGDVTISQLVEALSGDSPVTGESVSSTVEECDNPLRLESPWENLSLRLTSAGEVNIGTKRTRIINPKFLRFEGGVAQFTKAHWADIICDNDPFERRKFISSDAPWRVEADSWLRAKPAFRRGDFIILSD